MKPISIVVAAVVLSGVSSCLPPAQQTSGTAAYGPSNRYGYRGSVTDPSGQLGAPSAGPDGAIAQALSAQPGSGTLAQQGTMGAPPAGATGSSVTSPILPTVGTAGRPADTGIDPHLSTVPPAPVTGTREDIKPKPPQTGTTSRPLDPPVASKAKQEYPYGIPVPGKDGMVYSPFDKEAGYVDVRNMKPGALVEDPYTKKLFRVP